VLENRRAATLMLIDQFGVDNATAGVFKTLIEAPTCDFLFFLSSSTLSRFRDHPAVRQKIVRPNDPYHVRRATLDYYRGLLDTHSEYYLARFSIKNIYGLIFGSAHPRGMDKFLQVAWKEDEVNGEANFDIERDNLRPDQPTLFAPTKLADGAALWHRHAGDDRGTLVESAGPRTGNRRRQTAQPLSVILCASVAFPKGRPL